MFLEAFRNPLLEPLEDGASLDDRGRPAGVHHRLVRRLAAVLPRRRHRRPRRERHGERPGDVRGAAAVPVVRVHPRGGLPGRRPAADRRVDGRRGRARPGCRSSPATPRSSSAARRTAATSRRPGSGCWTGRARCRPRRRSPGDVVLVSGPIGDHGITVMLARGELDIEADIVSDTAPLHELTAALLDAVPDGRPAAARRDPRGSGDDLQRGRGGVAGRGGAGRERGAGAAGGERGVGAARDRPAVRGVRGTAGGGRRRGARRRRAGGAAVAARSGPGRRGSGRCATTRPAWCCCGRRSAAPGSWTCSSAIPCPGSAERASADARAGDHREHRRDGGGADAGYAGAAGAPVDRAAVRGGARRRPVLLRPGDGRHDAGRRGAGDRRARTGGWRAGGAGPSSTRTRCSRCARAAARTSSCCAAGSCGSDRWRWRPDVRDVRVRGRCRDRAGTTTSTVTGTARAADRPAGGRRAGQERRAGRGATGSGSRGGGSSR